MSTLHYNEKQRERGVELVKSNFFAGDEGGGLFLRKSREFVLQDRENNLYEGITSDAISYFRQNKIAWWGGRNVTGHILSSQVACLNHLFAIRQDKQKVLGLLKSLPEDFVDVVPIAEQMQGYIQFEAVGGDLNLLREGANTRGSNCTSVDALIIAIRRNGTRVLIPIEWKYVEKYGNEDKSKGAKGIVRKSRYTDLINNSVNLNSNTFSCCWYEPFYQLMRQTLWAERVLETRVKGFEADDFLHIMVVPDENDSLLHKEYKCSETGLYETWAKCLHHPEKFIIISPKDLWNNQDESSDLFRYLQTRYW